MRAEVKATETVGPVLIHIITEKGRGYVPAETASDKMHGVGKYDILTGKQIKPSTKARRLRAACGSILWEPRLAGHGLVWCFKAPLRSCASRMCMASRPAQAPVLGRRLRIL